MTDLTERLDRHLLNDDAEQRWLDADNLIEEALAEIEKLRGFLGNASKAYDRALSERDQFWMERDNSWDENQKLQERIAELDGFIGTINEQATALEAENARLRALLDRQDLRRPKKKL